MGEGDAALGFLGDGGPAFFLPAKFRRNDHSDSNWTASNSAGDDVYDKIVPSSN